MDRPDQQDRTEGEPINEINNLEEFNNQEDNPSGSMQDSNESRKKKTMQRLETTCLTTITNSKMQVCLHSHAYNLP